MAAQMSTCMKIVNSMSEADQDALLTRLDQYVNDGVPAEQAQLMAANDYMEELLAEQAEFRTLLQEQHPDLFVVEAEPMASAPRDPVVDTPAFRRWFGDSKVVDADGNPLVVYHGTIVRPTRDGTMMGDIAAFDRMFTTKFRAPSVDTMGSWFSTNPGEGGAEMYSGSREGSAIYPVYLSIKNPQVTTFQLLQRRARLLANGKDDGRMLGQAEVDAYRKWLEDMGKDGIKIEGSGNDGSTEFDNQVAWIALEPTQIKSATGNSGAFDPVNPDIRASAPRTPKSITSDPEEWAVDGEPTITVNTADFGGSSVVSWVDGDSENYVTSIGAYGDTRGTEMLQWLKSHTGKPSFAVSAVDDAIGFYRRMGELGLMTGYTTDTVESFFGIDFGDGEPPRYEGDVRFSAPRTPLGFYSELAEQIEKGPGQAPKDQWKAYIKGLQGKGVKADEVEWTGINDWLDLQEGKVKKSDVMGYLNNNGVQVEEVVLGGQVARGPAALLQVADGRTVKYHEYQLPGGENYREVLLTLPSQPKGEVRYDPAGDAKYPWAIIVNGKEVNRSSDEATAPDILQEELERAEKKGDYKSSHWDQPNVIAHIRMNDRTDADGNRVLFVEELQSDWAQAGSSARRKEVKRLIDSGVPKDEAQKRVPADYGFAGSKKAQMPELVKKYDALNAERRALEKQIADGDDADPATQGAVTKVVDVNRQMEELAAEMRAIRSGLPAAPFVQSTDGWLNLALKRIMVMAAEGGYDKVAFTTGAQNAERFSLDKQLNQIEFNKSGPDAYRVKAYDKNDGVVRSMPGEMSAAELERHLGKEIAERIVEQERGVLEGDGLKVEAKGMRAFYDTIVPNAVKALLKKLGGGQMEMVTVPVKDLTSAEREMNRLRQERGDPLLRAKTSDQPGFAVTDTMREKVSAGVPMFSAPRAPAPRLPIQGQRFTLPGEGRWMATRRKLQDQFIRVREVQRAIVEGGGVVGEAQDVYEAEARSYGRIQEQMKDFAERWVKPMVEKAGKAGVTLDELALYAYAKFAPERNRDIARKNPTLPDGGSGMTDQEAQDILDAFDQEGKTAVLDDLHRDLMAITATTRMVMLDEGLISRDEYDAMEDQFENYVPLRGFERVTEDGEPAPRRGVGRGFGVRGKETMRALGRTSRAGDIIENIIGDYEEKIVRAERNNVAKAFLDLVTTNPDSDLWEIDAVRTTRSLNRQTGQVEFNQIIDRTGVVPVKLAGKEIFIKVRDPLLLRAMTQASKDETAAVARFLNNTLGVYTNWMRNVLTRYNPVFSAVNAVRDYQAGNIAVLDKLGGEGVKLYNKYYAAGMASSFRNERGTLDQAAREMDKWFEAFRAAGGTTGGFFMRDAEEIRKDLRTVLLAAGAAPANKLEAIKGSKPYAGAEAILHWLEIAGSTSENAARVAAFRAAVELGKSPAEAASIAKNLTTNFNRKGEWGHVMNSLYLFFNAAVQGTHRVGQALKNPKVQALMAGTTATAMGLAFLGADFGGEDEDGEKYWDQIPDYEKERNLIFMLPPGFEMDGATKVGTNGRYIKIPLPYGFNVFPATGYAVADLIRNVQNPNHGASVGKAAIRATSALFGAYNPMGGAFDPTDPVQVGMAAAPTAVDLAIQLSAGVNPFGQPVGQFKSPYDDRPDSEIAGPREAGSVSQRLARWMNEATGGNAGRSGVVDVQPATINNLARTFAGGTGDFLWAALVNLPSKALTPEAEIMLKDVPVAKSFAGVIGKDADMRKFYERREETMKEFEAAKREMELGIRVDFDDSLQIAKFSMGAAAEKYTKAMSALRKEEVRIEDDPELTKAEKALQRKQLEKMRVEMARQFNTLYSTTMSEARSSQ